MHMMSDFWVGKYWGPFIYYVITILGFLDPPPPLRQHVFSTKNKQKLAFSAPPPPPLQVLT